MLFVLAACEEPADSFGNRMRKAEEAKAAAVAQAQQEEARAKAAAEAERQACVADAKAKIAAFRRLMNAGQYWDATLEIRACAEMTGDASLKRLIAEGEVKAYVFDLTSAKVPVATKERSLIALRRDYPDQARRFADWDQRLEKAAADEAAAAKRSLMAKRRNLLPPLGLTTKQVVEEWWGKPEQINRTIMKSGTREQWVYEGRTYLYFDDGILTAVQD